jgi:plastocyanin
MVPVVSSVIAVLLAALVLAAPAFAGGAQTAAASAVTVRLKDSYFSPAHVTLKRGRSVRFVWAGELVHNLLGPGIPNSLEDPVTRRRAFTRTFRHRGLVLFTCSIHPGMDLTVRVR